MLTDLLEAVMEEIDGHRSRVVESALKHLVVNMRVPLADLELVSWDVGLPDRRETIRLRGEDVYEVTVRRDGERYVVAGRPLAGRESVLHAPA